MKLLYTYTNGNYNVELYDDGTKIRETFDPAATVFRPVAPEQMDCKITNFCDMGRICTFCHEASHTRGQHADLDVTLEALDCLKPGVELAIGGGNPLSHPDLVRFLEELRKMGIVPNMTINELHLTDRYWDLIDHLRDNKLMFGTGVSFRQANKGHAGLLRMAEYENTVIHTIAGVDHPSKIFNLAREMAYKKFLILGYKDFRKGVAYRQSYGDVVDSNIDAWRRYLPSFLQYIADNGGIVSFDNLALEQLGVRAMMPTDMWDECYQGEEGTCSFYIDAVKQEFALNSMHPKRHAYNGMNIVGMFDHIRRENNVKNFYDHESTQS